VVPGHSECGAVRGACDDVKLGNLTRTLANIRHAVEVFSCFEGECNSKNKAFVSAVAHGNVRQTVDNILERSPVLAELVKRARSRSSGLCTTYRRARSPSWTRDTAAGFAQAPTRAPFLGFTDTTLFFYRLLAATASESRTTVGNDWSGTYRLVCTSPLRPGCPGLRL